MKLKFQVEVEVEFVILSWRLKFKIKLEFYGTSLYLKFEDGKTEWIEIPNDNIGEAPARMDYGIWRSGIPRSRSEEDEDLQRAIAASLGQTYVPPRRWIPFFCIFSFLLFGI